MAVLSIFRFLLVALIVSSAAFFTISQAAPSHDAEVADQHPFSYGNDEKGPKKWGSLKKEWGICNNGKLQSPIDMNNERVTILKNVTGLETHYRPSPATISNRGHDISVGWKKGSAGGIMLNGTFFEFVQVHWHSPSEHTVNGKSYALEGHLVHMSADSRIAVIGILYQVGRPSRFLAKVLSKAKTITEEGTDLGIVHPREIGFNRHEYYRYIGSLTTPPCTEGVIWSLVKKVKTVSLEQLHTLREAVHDGYEKNARPVQNTFGRPIVSVEKQ